MNRCLSIVCSVMFVGFLALPCQASAASITETSAAIGEKCVASGQYSTAMGQLTIASGDYSTAMGANTKASGFASTAMGINTSAKADYSIVIGRGYDDF